MGNDPFVLVVDDDEAIQDLLKVALEEGGFASHITSSGEEAITLLNANTYRILIIDIGFGSDRIKGWSVARRARAFNPDLPVIYITGGGTDEWSVHGVPRSAF